MAMRHPSAAPIIAIAVVIGGLVLVWRALAQQKHVFPSWMPPAAPDFVTAQITIVPDWLTKVELNGLF